MKFNIRQKLISKIFILIMIVNTLVVPVKYFYQSSGVQSIQGIGYEFLFHYNLNYEINGFPLLWQIDIIRYLVQVILIASIYLLMIKIYE